MKQMLTGCTAIGKIQLWSDIFVDEHSENATLSSIRWLLRIQTPPQGQRDR
jgi:hypothetical protein